MVAEVKEPRLSDVFLTLSNDLNLKLFEAYLHPHLLLTDQGERGGGGNTIDPNDFGGRRAYYRILGKLRNLSLIKRKKNKHREYEVTILGIVVYYNVILAARKTVLDQYWKLQAIDTLYHDALLPLEQRKRVIESLIQDTEIKNILFQFLGAATEEAAATAAEEEDAEEKD